MNVDVRFGSNDNSNFNPNSKITNNERCETIKIVTFVGWGEAVVVILFKDVEPILALLLSKANGLMLTVDSKMVFMEGKKNFKLILLKLQNFRHLSIQLLERYSEPDERFEIKEIEVYGWGKTCLSDVA